MTGKLEHQCTQCKKEFASKKALAQHRKDAHGGGKKSPPKKSGDVPVARSVKSGKTGKTSSGARESGRDRFAHFEDVSKMSSGKTLLHVVFTPHLLPRCSVLAKAYQRYTVHKLEFHIVPMLSSATSGGYIAAFIRDPEDQVSKNAADIVTSTAGSVTSKWWEESTVRCPSQTDKFYTATTPGQERFSSPGALVIAVDGKANQTGGVTVYVNYDISFYAPGLEAQKDSGTISVLGTLRMASGNAYLQRSSTSSTKAADMFSVEVEKGTILEAPHPIYYLINTANAITGIAAFKWIKHDDDGYVKPCDNEGTTYDELSYGNATVFFYQDQLTIKKEPENFQVGFEYLCNQKSSEPSLNPSETSSALLKAVSSLTSETPETSGESSTLSKESLKQIISSAQALLLKLPE